MSNLDFFGQKMFTMDGLTQLAPPLAVQPAVKGPPPYGIWPVSFTPEAVAEAENARIGQAQVPVVPVPVVSQADLFGVLLGLGAIATGLYVGLQPGKMSAQKYLAPGAAALAGVGLLVKSV